MLFAALPVPLPTPPHTPPLVTDPRVVAEFPLQKHTAGESHFPISLFQNSLHLRCCVLL